MNYILLAHCFFAGLLGMLFHLGFKFDGLRRRAMKSNEKISLKDFVYIEVVSIGLSVLAILILAFGMKELIRYKPGIEEWIRWTFIGWGGLGSMVLQKLFGNSEKLITKVIDAKTNLADKYINGGRITDDDLQQVKDSQDTLNSKKS